VSRVKFGRIFGLFIGISVIGLGCLGAALHKDEPDVVPNYAGFSEIDPVKDHFILVGDTQRTSLWEFWRERNDRERRLILNEIARREPAFVLHLGDLTTRGGSEKEWQDFDNLNKSLREKRIPYFPILGNHELYGNDKKALGYYFGRFPHLEQRRWYSFTWKNVGLIMVDSNFSTLTKEQDEIQKTWYLKELKRFEADEGIDHVIVSCHEPPFTNSRVIGPNEKVKTSFADPFVQFQKTCFFFSGHSHTYERFQIDGKFFIVSGGGGGPRHKVNIDPTTRPYNDLLPGPELRFFHFCEIELFDRALVLKVSRLEPDGTFSTVDQVSGTRVLSKGEG
jgi:hypothetical protein